MKIGLALGGGGVRGLAHVPVLEVLDEFGITPHMISGTSMGAIIGSIYAAGYPGAEIREGIQEQIIAKSDKPGVVWRKVKNLVRWLGYFRVSWGRRAMLSADGFLEFLVENMGVETFEQLKIPFHAVATDFYRHEAVVISSGEIGPAIKASMAIPGVFEPITIDGRVLVDGGVADNLPYDILMDQCDAVIAVDVVPTRNEDETEHPSMVDAALGTFDSLTETVTRFKLEERPPTIYVRPELVGIRTLDFDKIEMVYEQTEPAMEKFRADLTSLLEQG